MFILFDVSNLRDRCKMPEEKSNILHGEALDQIMVLFWAKGLNETSIDDIVLSSGISRGTLYKYFDDKAGLFINSLQQYLNTIIITVIEPIEISNDGLKSLIAFFQQFKSPKCPFYRKGCFLVQTATNDGSEIENVNDITTKFHKRLERCLSRNIQISLANNELHPNTNIEKTKDFLIGNLYGILTLLKAKVPLDTIINHVDGIVYYLNTHSLSKNHS